VSPAEPSLPEVQQGFRAEATSHQREDANLHPTEAVEMAV